MAAAVVEWPPSELDSAKTMAEVLELVQVLQLLQVLLLLPEPEPEPESALEMVPLRTGPGPQGLRQHLVYSPIVLPKAAQDAP